MKQQHRDRTLTRSILVLLWLAATRPLCAADLPDYILPDPELQVIRLDSAPTESFLAIKADTTGRLFVGGREALFVYEPNSTGGYQPRQQLLSFPNHTWVYDIEIRGDDLYILTVSALYLIPEGRIRRGGLQVRRLVWGVPMGHVHQCFHGMTWGPEGDLYFCMGDPLTYYGDFNRPDHWGYWTFFSRPPTTPPSTTGKRGVEDEAKLVRTPYNGVGGVFRCKPDGSNFQVVATGLRNNCGLAFDRDWNLFTNDNDHESIPADYVPGRLNHVVPHAYFSWPRGWMPSKTPDRLDLLETMNTKLGRFVPVGQSYYDDTYLPAKYRNSLLVARWCTRQITFYPLRHHGATFQCDEHELLAGRDLARPVHVTVGRGGRIFASVCYMAHNEGSPVYKSDLVMITRSDDSVDHPFDAYDAPTTTKEKLFAELAHPSWSRRLAAHTEILRRGGELLAEAADRLARRREDIAGGHDKLHLIWIAALARANPRAVQWSKLAADANPAVRLNSIRALAETGRSDTSIVPLLDRARHDPDPQVRLAGILSHFERDSSRTISSRDLNDGAPDAIRAANLGDSYIRQGTAYLLAERGTVDALGNDLQSGSPDERLLAVLAAGFRLTMPPVHQIVPAALPLAPWRNLEEAMKIHYIDGDIDLRDWGRSGLYTIAEHWKAAKRTDEQEQLFALLAARLGDADEKVRLQAAYFLSLLSDERTEPVIAKVRTDIQKARLATAPIAGVGSLWAVGPFVDTTKGFTTIHPPERGPLDPSAKYPADKNRSIPWKQIKQFENRYFDFRDALATVRGCSCYVATRIESGTKQQIQLLPGTDASFKVWLNGKFVHRSDVLRGALPFQEVIALDLEPGSNDLLIRLRDDADACRLYLHYRTLQPVAFVLPQPLEGETLAERLKEAAANPSQTKIDARFLDVNWDEAVKSGDSRQGKKLFSSDGLGCAKCHAVAADSPTTGGPSLAEAAKRFTVAHLVESVLLPNKTISPVFKATLIETKQGKTYTGLVVGDTAEKIEMIQTDTIRVTIPASEVEARRLQETSPMPAGLVKTPDELRDLLAYLLRGE